ncbi:VanZ family protein [Microbacterium dextranolyticum]|uniref:VanZ-like domain-containing protein n=1 Tax=Microbacterium dextranolyticum TaxID=36806 RepID=A0A9W6HKC2_9MICO|nr:VanZ family protein [Microbacterium dextranolyticum]MBM7462095.1 hypothetical protein [Microbacterium dextranolyticum]GLJ94339.1 hypothetical protein GCM10017591_04000 [Microbacterium dextranolyticum]
MREDQSVIPPRPPLPAQSADDAARAAATAAAQAAAAQTARAAANAATTTAAAQPEAWASRMVREPRAWLVVYVVTLALIAFWPVPVDSGAGPFLRTVTRLFPMLTYDRIEFGANVVLFVPWGLLLTFLLPTQRWLVLPIAFLTTFAIECGQGLALAARTPSVHDLVANTAGACLGMLIAVFAEILARSRTTLP